MSPVLALEKIALTAIRQSSLLTQHVRWNRVDTVADFETSLHCLWTFALAGRVAPKSRILETAD